MNKKDYEIEEQARAQQMAVEPSRNERTDHSGSLLVLVPNAKRLFLSLCNARSMTEACDCLMLTFQPHLISMASERVQEQK
jgi:hypothetical protein